MSAAGWDTMHCHFRCHQKLNGKVEDGSKVIDVMKGWTGNIRAGSLDRRCDPRRRAGRTRNGSHPEADGKRGIKVRHDKGRKRRMQGA
jgi:hypothetical protein